MVEEMLLILQIVVSVVVIGYIDVEVDGDGVVCGVYLYVGIGQLYWLVLGLVLVDLFVGVVCGLFDFDLELGLFY